MTLGITRLGTQTQHVIARPDCGQLMRALVVTGSAAGGGARRARPGAGRRRTARRGRAGRHLRHRRRALHRRDGLHRAGSHALPASGSATSGPAASSRVGDAADERWLGKRVTGDTMLGCGHCEYCLAGTPPRLPEPVRGRHPRRLGGRARREDARSPTRFAYEIPEHVSVTAAALVEPGGNSLRAVRAPRTSSPATGCSCSDPARSVCSPPSSPWPRAPRCTSAECAKGRSRSRGRSGLQHTWQLDELADSPSDQFDAVIEATSNEAMPALSVRLAKPAGRVVYIGLSSTPSLVDTRDIALKDITAVGILSASPGLAGAIEHFADGVGRARRDRQRGRRTRGRARPARRTARSGCRARARRCTSTPVWASP